METRRNFILKIARISSVVLLSSTTTYLLLRDNNGETCNLANKCGGCSKLSGCNLSKANDYRDSTKSSLQSESRGQTNIK